MPRYDGKGPEGKGKLTGRKTGLCEDSNLTEEQKESLESNLENKVNRPFGRGFGRGRGFSRGLGYGCRMGYGRGRRW